MKKASWNYLVETIYSEETTGFYTIEEAKYFIQEEIKDMNKKCGSEAWGTEDFRLYKFDAANWRWVEIELRMEE